MIIKRRMCASFGCRGWGNTLHFKKKLWSGQLPPRESLRGRRSRPLREPLSPLRCSPYFLLLFLSLFVLPPDKQDSERHTYTASYMRSLTPVYLLCRSAWSSRTASGKAGSTRSDSVFRLSSVYVHSPYAFAGTTKFGCPGGRCSRCMHAATQADKPCD